jgi:DUF971 family protein
MVAAPPAPPPTELKLKRGRNELEISFPDGVAASLSAEYLRVHSPSAEVTQHGSGEGVLVAGKENVAIARIEPVGRYAVRLVFDDGHDTGLYTWAVLHELCRDRERKWRRYLERLDAAGHTRSGRAGA